jgi:lipopolysaccharide/colanic/teichoic acid biosynthesis glycosyltransferase
VGADEGGVSRPGRLILYLGTAAAVIGLSKAHAVASDYVWSGSSRFAWSLTFIGLLGLTAYAFGLPEQPRTRRAALLSALLATLSAAAVISLVQLVVGDALLPRVVVFGSVLVLIPWYALCAEITHDTDVWASERDRVLVVAASSELESLESDLRSAPERPAVVVGWLTPDETEFGSVPPMRPLLTAASDLRATVVVLSRAAQSNDDVVLQASQLHQEGVRIRTLSMFYEQWLGKLPINELERLSLLFDIGEVHAAWYARVKRLVDIVLALCGTLALLAIMPFVVLGDLVANRGPLFYRQARTGRNGKPFDMLKLRTMREYRTDEAADWTAEDDSRITPFGNFLRRTHLDELPQVLNILRGDLSVVGPRPEQPHIVADLIDKIPFYGLRHVVRPGLTGWAQVKYQYAGTEAETLEKLQYEFYYLRHQGIGLDLRVVGRTARSVVGREGR